MATKRAQGKRQSHAERTRAEILDVAVMLAAKEGLEGLTIGRLAAEAQMSKGGLFAHFGSKEALQLATIDEAFRQFASEVVEVALRSARGVEQLSAMMNAYFAYVERRAESGGCFFTAASLEFDDRPGPVRDRITELLAQRNSLVLGALEDAKRRRSIHGDVAQLAFEAIAIATGANVQFQLCRDREIFERARVAFERMLAQAQTPGRARRLNRSSAAWPASR